MFHGREKYCCLPMYEEYRMQFASMPTNRESKNWLLTRRTVTRKLKKSADSFFTRQWHKLKGAKVRGGIPECAF